MRGRNHDRKLAVSVLVANVSSNADNHTVIVLIYHVNTNTNIFYYRLQMATFIAAPAPSIEYKKLEPTKKESRSKGAAKDRD
ncbi:hypothetical protein A6R74_08885 [Halomonas sp. ALS9]|nr:hypothetical protein A6R74_08885 [Halomonas sp. ALS9]